MTLVQKLRERWKLVLASLVGLFIFGSVFAIGAASCLFNGMVNPLIPCAITGAIWYQGESNCQIHFLRWGDPLHGVTV